MLSKQGTQLSQSIPDLVYIYTILHCYEQVSLNYTHLGQVHILSTTAAFFGCPGHAITVSWMKDFTQDNMRCTLLITYNL